MFRKILNGVLFRKNPSAIKISFKTTTKFNDKVTVALFSKGDDHLGNVKINIKNKELENKVIHIIKLIR